MERSDFVIKEIFWCKGQRWRCTDIGTRVIMAIRLYFDYEENRRWYAGTPYGVPEIVFDESDMKTCTAKPKGRISKARIKIVHSTGRNIKIPPETPAQRERFLKKCMLRPEPVGMRRQDFEIGGIFRCGDRWLRCNDIGTRTVVATEIDHLDDDRLPGNPPNAAEYVFDENDVRGCTAVLIVEEQVLAWLRKQGPGGYQTKLEAILQAAMLSEKAATTAKGISVRKHRAVQREGTPDLGDSKRDPGFSHEEFRRIHMERAKAKAKRP